MMKNGWTMGKWKPRTVDSFNGADANPSSLPYDIMRSDELEDRVLDGIYEAIKTRSNAKPEDDEQCWWDANSYSTIFYTPLKPVMGSFTISLDGIEGMREGEMELEHDSKIDADDCYYADLPTKY